MNFTTPFFEFPDRFSGLQSARVHYFGGGGSISSNPPEVIFPPANTLTTIGYGDYTPTTTASRCALGPFPRFPHQSRGVGYRVGVREISAVSRPQDPTTDLLRALRVVSDIQCAVSFRKIYFVFDTSSLLKYQPPRPPPGPFFETMFSLRFLILRGDSTLVCGPLVACCQDSKFYNLP